MTYADSSAVKSQNNIVITKTDNEEIIDKIAVGNSKLVYTLIKNTITIDGQINDVYGIEAECSLFGNKESARVQDVTTNLDLAKEIFDIIADNAVLPVSLKDIIEDFIVKKYS